MIASKAKCKPLDLLICCLIRNWLAANSVATMGMISSGGWRLLLMMFWRWGVVVVIFVMIDFVLREL
jgi:hypothetical protein